MGIMTNFTWFLGKLQLEKDGQGKEEVLNKEK